jgi:transcriptional regulator with XRE-family HTH domain
MKKLIGKKLKATRLQHDQTIQELADRSGVSANMISRMERGLTIPSVKILMKLAAAFGMSISYFVEEAEKGSSVVFTPKGKGEPIFFFKDKQQILSLTQGLRDPSFTVLYDTIEEGCSSGGSDMVQVGEEFLFILDGCLEFLIQGKTYVLTAGDSLMFQAPLPHQWRNLAQGPTRVLWVVSPPPAIDQ